MLWNGKVGIFLKLKWRFFLQFYIFNHSEEEEKKIYFAKHNTTK